jgi:DNA-binding NtrC family response regulator
VLFRANSAAIPSERIASELLGRQIDSRSQATQPCPGDSSFPTGTIFVEGIADLSAQAQLPQLRVLQEIESEPARGVRLIAAANRDLPADAANGTFRSDLFGRLNGIPIKIPPPYDRKEVPPCGPGIFSLATLDEHGRNCRA